MVGIHHFVVSSYLNFAIGVTGVVVQLLLGESLWDTVLVASQFSVVSWVLVVLASVLVMVAQTTKFLAVQNYPAGKLQVFAYFMLPAQFFVDTVFFGVRFNRMQLAGLALFVSLYSVIFARFCLRRDIR